VSTDDDGDPHELASLAARNARAMVTMRLHQEPGTWFEGEDQDRFLELWTEGWEADEDAFVLTLVNMAAGLLRWLEQISGEPAAEWLQDWAASEAAGEDGPT
jgi:hypothetical protein